MALTNSCYGHHFDHPCPCLYQGLPIFGPIEKSGRWASLDEPPKMTIEEITTKAWGKHREVFAKAKVIGKRKMEFYRMLRLK